MGIRASEAASIDGVWAYGRNFSVSELGRGHVIRNKQIALMHVLIKFNFFCSHRGGWLVTPVTPLPRSVSAPAPGHCACDVVHETESMKNSQWKRRTLLTM